MVDSAPGEYDHPYTEGQLLMWPAKDQAEIRAMCPRVAFGIGVALACTTRRSGSCTVAMVPDDEIQRAGFPPEIVMRHEIAHCNGWSAEHEGALPFEEWAEPPPAPKPAPSEDDAAALGNWLGGGIEDGILKVCRAPEMYSKYYAECDAVPKHPHPPPSSKVPTRPRTMSEILFGR